MPPNHERDTICACVQSECIPLLSNNLSGRLGCYGNEARSPNMSGT